MNIVNFAAYRFTPLDNLPELQEHLRQRCAALGLRGTILLAPEGINLFVAGTRAAVDALMENLRTDTLFDGKFKTLQGKESLSEKQPFRYLRVKLKKEIITMHAPVSAPTIRPDEQRAPAVDAATLKRWLDQGHDDAGQPIVLLDTRNAFEVDIGTFSGAVDYRLRQFSDFPAAIAARCAELAGKTVVSFCTGGIRCEKAVLYMHGIGMTNVYQLEGGILKYFEEAGSAHYQGDCFVFDERIALSPTLTPVPPSLPSPLTTTLPQAGKRNQTEAALHAFKHA
jgi:UPF0176 protein